MATCAFALNVVPSSSQKLSAFLGSKVVCSRKHISNEQQHLPSRRTFSTRTKEDRTGVRHFVVAQATAPLVVEIGTPSTKPRRLTLETRENIFNDTDSIRCLDWDRDRFDIEFGLENGTTYNSFVIHGDKVALVDSSHEKFRDQYWAALSKIIDPSKIDYLIVSHTEPDHSGLTYDLLEKNPDVTIVGTKVALQFLENLAHRPFKRLQVKSGDSLDLGKGHILDFINAPNLHWPDTMFTYDRASQVLFTCDAFGMHYCSSETLDEDLTTLLPHFRFYYDCLMRPNSRSVLSALKRVSDLPYESIATGHGPLLKHNVGELTRLYGQWSADVSKKETTVGVLYVADYGYSDRLSQAVASGVAKTNKVAVEMLDLKSADAEEIKELVAHSKGIVVMTPPTSGEAQAGLGTVLGAVTTKQVVGIVESYGGDDEPVDTLLNKFRDLGVAIAFPPIRIKDTPGEASYQLCEEAGTDLGQLLTKAQAIKEMKSLEQSLDKALGRLSGGLYIITAVKGEKKSAMLASWVAQASFKPLGITIAVAKDRAIESLMQVGDTFVLNVLEEGKHLGLMKHFLKRFPPGSDRFQGINTTVASNSGLILSDVLAFLECTVVSRMEGPDHWIIYSHVTNGNISSFAGMTAVHHRKVGNHY